MPPTPRARAGIAGLTRLLANEWAAHGINVNAIAPGYFATNNTAALRDDAKRNREILARIPAGRWGEPEDLGGAAVFLASARGRLRARRDPAGRRRLARALKRRRQARDARRTGARGHLQALRQRPDPARTSTSTSRPASSSSSSARRAAASPRCCASSPGSRTPTSGSVHIGERDVTDVPAVEPRHRDGVSVVRAVPAHDASRDNMAFGAARSAARPQPRSPRGCAARPRSCRWATCSIASRERCRAASASAWRSAARSCASRDVFLFDEPLSNLDAALRGQMRVELARLHAQLGTTMIYVTHDQVEAMTLASKIVVLNGGADRAGRRAASTLYRRPGEPVRRRLPRLAEDELHRRQGSAQATGAPRSACARRRTPITLPLVACRDALRGRTPVKSASGRSICALRTPARVVLMGASFSSNRSAGRRLRQYARRRARGRGTALGETRRRAAVARDDLVGLQVDAAQCHLFDRDGAASRTVRCGGAGHGDRERARGGLGDVFEPRRGPCLPLAVHHRARRLHDVSVRRLARCSASRTISCRIRSAPRSLSASRTTRRWPTTTRSASRSPSRCSTSSSPCR